MQIPLFKPQTEWLPPENFPDLSKYDEIAIDLETKDPDLMKMGSGSVVGKGDVVGIADKPTMGEREKAADRQATLKQGQAIFFHSILTI